MRHRKKGKRLNRNTAHRKALVNNIVKSVIKYQKVETTLAKAKVAQQLIERLIAKAKQGDLNSYRSVNQVLNDRNLTTLLVSKISPRFKNRNGGFTRIVHLGSRQGDNSPMVILELTAKEEKPETKKISKKRLKKTDIKSERLKEQKDETTEKIKIAEKPESQEKKMPIEAAQREKSKGFAEGLRKFFKRKK